MMEWWQILLIVAIPCLVIDNMVVNICRSHVYCKSMTQTKSVVTNRDYINSLTDEEFSTYINCCSHCSVYDSGLCDSKCKEHIVEWLKQERKEK